MRRIRTLIAAKRAESRAWNDLYAAADALHPSRLDRLGAR